MPGICLVTSYADCVPLYFVDPVRKGGRAEPFGLERDRGKDRKKDRILLMQEAFGSDPADILAAAGPSVCMDCYEVSGDVIDKSEGGL